MFRFLRRLFPKRSHVEELLDKALGELWDHEDGMPGAYDPALRARAAHARAEQALHRARLRRPRKRRLKKLVRASMKRVYEDD